MSEIKLLPCPFCNGEAKISDEDFIKGHFVFCTECGIQTKLYIKGNTIEKAVSDWNTRKPMERIVERLEKEKGMADEELEQCIFKALPYHDSIEGTVIGFKRAIRICKEEGGIDGIHHN